MAQQARRTKVTIALLVATVLVAIAGLGLAGCADNGDSGSTDSRGADSSAGAVPSMAEPDVAADPAAPNTDPATTLPGNARSDAGSATEIGPASDSASSPAGVATAPKTVSSTEAKVVMTADVGLEVRNLRKSVDGATTAISALGGDVANENIVAGDRRSPAHASVTYRVPTDRFREALAAIDGVGKRQHQTVSSDDVTSQYTDLDSRVTTLRTSVTRLQSFLAEATDVSQIGILEGELTRRESELESIEAQRRALSDQIAMATIVVGFERPGAPGVVGQDEPTGFAAGLSIGWDALSAIGGGIATAAGFALLFLPLGLVAVAGGWWLRRRPAKAAELQSS